jgi:hypothetical protein
MNHIKKPLRILLAVVAATQLAACSKTVEWEEKVPLNTREVTWVKRSISYVRSSAYANPLQPSWKPEFETLAFELDKKKYEWKGDSSPLLLAINLQRQPTIVANARSFFRWGDRHGYNCVKPYYVQFIPQAGGYWKWPSAIEPWLHEMPTNLLIHVAASEEMPKRVTSTDRVKFDAYTLKNYPESVVSQRSSEESELIGLGIRF